MSDEAGLEQLAAETSGLDEALPVLEAVAHHGGGWIDLEHDRWNRRPLIWSG